MTGKPSQTAITHANGYDILTTAIAMFGVQISLKGGPVAGKENVKSFEYVENVRTTVPHSCSLLTLSARSSIK